MDSETELRLRARKIAEDKIGFYVHLAIYLLVNSMLIFVWWWGGGGFPWFVFVLVFWGIGVVAHGVGTFIQPHYTDRMAEKEYQRLKGQR
ncbi:MAG: 2TM domain-containing protein [Methanomassiliicoccus sp.]|nr:2TM domain-containing protein [Methanomassiliicoccus sp.]